MKKVEKPLTDARKIELVDTLAKANGNVAKAREKTQSLRVKAKQDMESAQNEVDGITKILLDGFEIEEIADEDS